MVNTYSVYILTCEHGKAMYIGVTNNLERRLAEHKSFSVPGFTKKYKISKLVYYEQTSSIESAILREKELKGWRREKKNALVETINPYWEDLSHISPDPSLRSG